MHAIYRTTTTHLLIFLTAIALGFGVDISSAIAQTYNVCETQFESSCPKDQFPNLVFVPCYAIDNWVKNACGVSNSRDPNRVLWARLYTKHEHKCGTTVDRITCR